MSPRIILVLETCFKIFMLCNVLFKDEKASVIRFVRSICSDELTSYIGATPKFPISPSRLGHTWLVQHSCISPFSISDARVGWPCVNHTRQTPVRQRDLEMLLFHVTPVISSLTDSEHAISFEVLLLMYICSQTAAPPIYRYTESLLIPLQRTVFDRRRAINAWKPSSIVIPSADAAL